MGQARSCDIANAFYRCLSATDLKRQNGSAISVGMSQAL